jgi:hypothetical protein
MTTQKDLPSASTATPAHERTSYSCSAVKSSVKSTWVRGFEAEIEEYMVLPWSDYRVPHHNGSVDRRTKGRVFKDGS